MEQTRGHAAQPEAIGEGEQHLDGGVLLLGLVGHFGRDRDPQLRCAWPFCGCGQVFLAISDRCIEVKLKSPTTMTSWSSARALPGRWKRACCLSDPPHAP